MPRKSKITAVPIDAPVEEVTVVTEPTDAEQMTEIVKVIAGEAEQPIEEPQVNDACAEEPQVSEEPAVKPKAKRAPRAKKDLTVEIPPKKEVVITEGVVSEVTHTIDEVEAMVDLGKIQQVPTKQKEAKENARVECPDCGKKMSAKTLRYSHGPNCLFKKQADKEEAAMMAIPDEVIEAEVQKRMSCAKAERLNRRQKQIESLVASAF